MASSDLGITFLSDGGQPPDAVASQLADFMSAATTSLDIAVYDCALQGDLAARVAESISAATQRGVRVRFAYYAGPHVSAVIPPPKGSSEEFASHLQVPARPVHGYQALMHHKYVVRDAASSSAAVWTGSTNWTADAWNREENVIITIPSPEIAALYTGDFEELWNTSKVEDTGARDGGSAPMSFNGATGNGQVWFSPGGGVDMAKAVASSIASAQRRIVVASPVLTEGDILGALQTVVEAGRVPVSGVYDATQMAEVRHQWQEQERSAWKIDAFDQIVQAAGMAGKRSTPYAPGSVHDYMHMKMVVVDDGVYIGSYNFSRSGEENAENLLRIDIAALADVCVDAIERVIARYAGASTSRSSAGG